MVRCPSCWASVVNRDSSWPNCSRVVVSSCCVCCNCLLKELSCCIDARVSVVGMGAGVVCSCRPMIAMGILVSETSARMNRRSAPNGLSEEGSKVGPKVAMRFGVLRGDEIVVDLDK